MVIEDEESIASYYDLQKELTELRRKRRLVENHPSFAAPFLQPGRLVRIVNDGMDFGWGVIINFQRRVANVKSGEGGEAKYVVDVLLNCDPKAEKPVPCRKDEKRGIPQVVPVLLETFDGLSSVRIFVPNELKSLDARLQVMKTVSEIERRFEAVPLLEAGDLRITDESFLELLKRVERIEERLKSHPLKSDPRLEEKYAEYESKSIITLKVKLLKKQIQQAQSVLQLDELKARKRVLRRLGYVDDADVIEKKGRVACEISTGDELMLTELIFNGVFNDLSVEQTCSLLACFVYQEKGDEGKGLREDMKEPIRVLRETARRIAQVSVESKLPVNEDEYVNSFQTELSDVVYAWAQGAKFSQIVKMTDAFEGSIIRAMRRLEELLRQMANASKAIGNVELEKKFELGIEKIKRGVVFAASLFL
jgi:ATP-dependent RNA helicase DOB1